MPLSFISHLHGWAWPGDIECETDRIEEETAVRSHKLHTIRWSFPPGRRLPHSFILDTTQYCRFCWVSSSEIDYECNVDVVLSLYTNTSAFVSWTTMQVHEWGVYITGVALKHHSSSFIAVVVGCGQCNRSSYCLGVRCKNLKCDAIL